MACERKCNDCCLCLSPIPNGGTCESACAHIKRCVAFGFTDNLANTFCSFIPSRFAARKSPSPTPQEEKP